jgi:hypothetical protein
MGQSGETVTLAFFPVRGKWVVDCAFGWSEFKFWLTTKSVSQAVTEI